MDETAASRYWCHMCSQVVNPVLEIEDLKCPLCQSGFIEEMASAAAASSVGSVSNLDFGAPDSGRALSLWAPVLLGMMNDPHRRHRFRRLEYDDDDDEEANENDAHRHEEETELDRELELLMRRSRRRSSASILHLLQSIRAGMVPEPNNSEGGEHRERDRDGRDRERVILINPFNQTIIVQGSYDSNDNSENQPIGSLGDYFIGPGLDMLLQHLAENDPNRYGTPPAQKEAVEAMPTVKIEETLQCSVCLDDFEIGTEAKEMPCKHKFHSGCILPWLELHSSCPVCRYQLPSDESKRDSDGTRSSSRSNNAESNNGNNDVGGSSREWEDRDDRNESGRRFTVPLPWPFSSLFSSSGSQSNDGHSSSSSTTSSNAPSSDSHRDEN